MSFPSLLAPQEQEREVYPYRRVWRTAVIEVGVLLIVTFAAVIVTRLYKGTISDTQRSTIGIGFAVLPAMLWLAFSYFFERRAQQPRSRIFTVALISGLAANAVGIPIVDRVFTINDWLANASGTARIIGFTVSVGMVQEFIKYVVIRYSVWPNGFRIRSDGAAYALAAGVGYATALNLNYVLNNSADPASFALRISEFTLLQYAAGLIVGYFLAELKFSKNQAIFWMPGALLGGALLTGVMTAARGGLIVGGLSTTSNASNPVQGVIGVAALTAIMFGSFYGLINNADERTRLRGRRE
jgi:RsiW-degrading membrane proteinase PrsW (M82 family)